MGLVLHIQIIRAGQPVGQLQFDSDQHRTIKIGRLASAQVKLEDQAVARIHAVIELAGADVSLIDMGSTAGSMVNGAKVHKVKLNHGDQIQAGDTTLIVGLGGPPGVQPGQPAAPAAMPGAAIPGAPGAAIPGMPGAAIPGMPGAAVPGLPGTAAPGMPGAAVAGTALPGLPGSAIPGLPGAAVPGMPGVAGAPVPQTAGFEGPTQPRFDGGNEAAGQVPRTTNDRLRAAAVEMKPHPSLPPERELSKESRILEMRAYWGEVLLSMQHHAKPKQITIGENRRTNFFISSEGLPVEEFPLMRFIDDDYYISFTQDMEGEVELSGGMQTFQQLRGSSLVKKDDSIEGTYLMKLPLDGRSLTHWGGASFAMRFVPPTKPIPRATFKDIDLQYLNMFLLSLFFHVAMLVTMLVYPYDTDALRVDLFDEPDRFAQLVIQGPQETESTKDLLAELKKKVEEKKEKLEKPKDKPELLIKKKNTPVKPVKTKSQKKAEVAQKFSKLFSGSDGGSGSLLGGGGGGTLAGTLSNVIGTTGKGSSSAGIAGLGIRGSGPLTGGGIGTSRGIAGIGTSGRLGGGGTAYGSGVSMGKRRNRGMISLSTPVIMGALPPEVIKKVINQNKNQIRYCYEVELQRNQKLEGRIMMTWIIAATGNVAKARVKSSTVKNANVERCIASKIKGWKFPAPAGGGIVEVNYPFVFQAG